MKIKKFLKHSIACVLSCMMLMQIAVPMTAFAESTSSDNKAVVSTKSTASNEPKEMKTSDVDASYLLSKNTDSCVIDESNGKAPTISNANESAADGEENLFNYSDFGFNEKSMNDTLSNVTDNNTLEGMEAIIPEELVITQKNKGDDYKGEIRDVNNTSDISSASDVNKMATSNNSVSLNGNNQVENTICVDLDNDDIDELVKLSLSVNSDDDGKLVLEIYKRVKSNDNQKGSWEKIDFNYSKIIQTDDDIEDIQAQNSKGFTSMTGGDFDNDGYDEIAFYVAGDGENVYPSIYFIDYQNNTYVVNDNMNIRIDTDINNMFSKYYNLYDGSGSYDDWYCPVVALSTTSTRISGAGTEKEKSYDDLVINVSVPRCYDNDDVNLCSNMAIMSYNNKWEILYCKELSYSKTRMIFPNSVDADLNGDGYKDLIVAGWKEDYSSAEESGTISETKGLVQMIGWDGNSYKPVWTDGNGKEAPKTVTWKTDMKLENNQEPIALTSGHYRSSVPQAQEDICINDTVFSASNTSIYAQDITTEINGNNPIVQTFPNHNAENFVDSSLTALFSINIRSGDYCDADNNPFVSTAISGTFLTPDVNSDNQDVIATGKTDVIVLLTGDTVSGMGDLIDYDLVFYYCDSAGKWHVVVDDDYMHRVDEDDNGTSISICFGNTDDDISYIKYKGSTMGYSSPALYSVVQAAPYYKENNGASMKFSVSSGHSHGTRGSWNVGGSAGIIVDTTLKVPFFKANQSWQANLAASYTGYRTVISTVDTKTDFTINADKDYAVVFATPVVVGSYSMWVTNNDNGSGEWQDFSTVQELTPTFTTISLTQYNELASKLYNDYTDAVENYYNTNPENEDNVSSSNVENALRKVEDKYGYTISAPVVDVLPKSDPGNPSGYMAEDEAYLFMDEKYGIDKDDDSDVYSQNSIQISENNEAQNSSLTSTFSVKTERGNGFDIKLSASMTTKAGAGVAGNGATVGYSVGVSGGGGCLWIDADTEGYSLTSVYNTVKPSSIDLDGEYADDSTLVRYKKEGRYDNNESKNANYYTYTTNSIAFITNKVSSDTMGYKTYSFESSGGLPYLKSENVEYKANDIYILSYSVSGIMNTPAQLPKYFGMESVTKNLDKDNNITSYTIRFAINASERDKNRIPAGYNLYVKNIRNDASASDDSYTLVNTEGPIIREDNSKIINYDVKLSPNEAGTTFTFLLTALDNNATDKNTYFESIPSNTVAVNALNTFVVIDQQPESVYFSDDGQEVAFSVSALDDDSITSIAYQWQKFNTSSNKWENIINNSTAKTNELHIKAYFSEELTPIRCKLTLSSGLITKQTIYSNAVTYYHQSNPNDSIENSSIFGDVNKSGLVDIIDAKLIQKSLVSKYDIKNIDIADVDNDGKITVKDATAIQKYIVGLINSPIIGQAK